MVSLVIFDLDGVLVEAKQIHYEALNQALGETYAIEWNEHLSIYDGLKTNQKLDMLHERKGLPKEQFINIWNNKQKYTLEALSNLKKDEILYSTIQNLSLDGYKLAVCSNSIRKTVLTVFETEMLKRSKRKVKDSAEAAAFLHSEFVLHEANEPRRKLPKTN